MSFCFYKFHQEFAGKIGKDAETAFLLLPGVGWRTRMASTEEKLHGGIISISYSYSFIYSINHQWGNTIFLRKFTHLSYENYKCIGRKILYTGFGYRVYL